MGRVPAAARRAAARQTRTTEAYHDIAQSSSVFELVGERYQAAVSQLALGRLASRAGARSTADRHFQQAAQVFESLGASRDLEEVRGAMSAAQQVGTGEYVGSPADADDALVRRLVDAAMLPELLARELTAALLEAVTADVAVVVRRAARRRHLGSSRTPAPMQTPRAPSRDSASRARAYGAGSLIVEHIGREPDGPRAVAVASSRPLGHHLMRRVRMMAAVARQGFDLCGARERPTQTGRRNHRTAARAAGAGIRLRQRRHASRRRSDSAPAGQRPDRAHHRRERHRQGAGRARHPRRIAAQQPPCSCPTTARRPRASWPTASCSAIAAASFTGAVSDQPGLMRTAAGGTLFLDEVGDLPLDVQPKLLRFLEQGEIMPVGETRPLRVDVRVITATNADLEQRVAEGKFREDLYYRLSVIRIHVPPLRQRREEIPHLSTFFLREACERLGKPDVQLSSEVLDLFAQYWWPGNVRQLRNEVQRAVAMAAPGGTSNPSTSRRI